MKRSIEELDNLDERGGLDKEEKYKDFERKRYSNQNEIEDDNDTVNGGESAEDDDDDDSRFKDNIEIDIPSEAGPISDEPSQIHSHFVRVSEANRKGQARFKCVKCDHAFECSGRKRLIQHILGYSHQANRYKNVRACPNPHQPLKDALMAIYPRHICSDGEKKRRRRRRKEGGTVSSSVDRGAFLFWKWYLEFSSFLFDSEQR